MTKVWKVVRCMPDGRNLSAIVGNDDDPSEQEFVIEYTLGERARAVEGTVGILCFQNFHSAWTFSLSMRKPNHDLGILLCETEDQPRDVRFLILFRGGYGSSPELPDWHAMMTDQNVRAGYINELLASSDADFLDEDVLFEAPRNTCAVDSLTPKCFVRVDDRKGCYET